MNWILSLFLVFSSSCFCWDISLSYVWWLPSEEGLVESVNLDPSNLLQPESTSTFPKIVPKSGIKIFCTKVFDLSKIEFSMGYTGFYNGNNRFNSVDYPLFNEVNSHPYLVQNAPRETLVQSSSVGDLLACGRTACLDTSSTWDNNFNILEARWGIPVGLSTSTTTTPFFGIVAAWEEQRFRLSHSFAPYTISKPPAEADGNSMSRGINNWDYQQKWWGIGPYMGITGEYVLTHDNTLYLSLIGRPGVGCLSDNTDLIVVRYNLRTGYRSGDNGVREEYPKYRDIVRGVAPFFGSLLGVVVRAPLIDDIFVKFMLGWEQQVWFGHNLMTKRFLSSGAKGSYSMQGLTLSCVLSF